MIKLYKDKNLEISVPENFEECLICQTDHTWCTTDEKTYDIHTRINNEVLIRFIYKDGYAMSLGVNPNNYEVGQWIDNIENPRHYTIYPLRFIDNDLFNHAKIKEFSLRKKDKDLENMSLRISELSDKVKEIVTNFIQSKQS